MKEEGGREGREGGRGDRVRSISGSKTPSLLPGRGLSRSLKEREGRDGGSMSGRNARRPRREGGRDGGRKGALSLRTCEQFLGQRHGGVVLGGTAG